MTNQNRENNFGRAPGGNTNLGEGRRPGEINLFNSGNGGGANQYDGNDSYNGNINNWNNYNGGGNNWNNGNNAPWNNQPPNFNGHQVTQGQNGTDLIFSRWSWTTRLTR